MSLNQYSQRALTQRLGRTTLTILSIVIGVAAVIAVTLLTATTRSAYKQMFATVTGRATLEVQGLGGASFQQDVLEKVREVSGVQAAVPLLNKPSILYFNDHRIRLQTLGIDPEVDSAVRDYAVVSGRGLKKGDELLLDEEFARHIGAKTGDTVKLLTRRSIRPRELEIVGLLRPQGGATLRQAALVFLPLSRAQYLLGDKGKTDEIDSIQIVTDDKQKVEDVQRAVAAVLPDELKVNPPASNTQLMQQTLLSSEQGLWLATAFTLLMGAFIILNTFLMNLGERRRQLAIMRAIGATGGQLMWMLIKESVLLGALGTLVGTIAGVSVAYLINDSLSQALEVTLPSIWQVISVWPFVLGAIFGFGISLLGALVPAWRARKVSPLEGMSRVTSEDMSGASPKWVVAGLILGAIGGAIIYAGVTGRLSIYAPRYGALALLLGTAIGIIPLILAPFAQVVTWFLQLFSRVEASLALRQILRHRVRTSLTVFVLFLAGCAGVGLANSLLDNVDDVREWYKQAVVGDFFVRAMMPDMGSGTAPDLPDELGAELEKVPRIRSMDSVSFIQVNIPAKNISGLVPSESSDQESLTAIAIARGMKGTGQPAFDLVEGDVTKLREQMYAGEVVIGTVLAQRLGLKAGDNLPIETVEGVKQLPIAGVTNEYMVGGLAVHMQRDVAVPLFGLEGVDGYIIRANAEDLSALQADLTKLADKYGVLVHSSAEISKRIDAIVAGVDGGLWALIVLGFVVAAFGVVNTLTMNVLEQTRELGMLRIVAMTKSQVRRTIVLQALIIGTVGILPGIAAGLGTAYVMNAAMMPSFGHPIEFGFHPWLLLSSLGGSLAVTLIAAWLPARRATQIDVVEALHYE